LVGRTFAPAGELFRQDEQVIRSKAWFLKHYATVMKANVLKQDPDDYFKNYQGVTLGDGGRNIWIDNFGDGRAGLPTRLRSSPSTTAIEPNRLVCNRCEPV
jgi:hypothetical protein